MTDNLVNTTTTDSQSNPSVAIDADGDFVVTWQSYNQDGSSYGIYARRYNASGAALGGEFRVNTHTASSEESPSVAIDADGDFVVVWQSYYQDSSYGGIYARRYNASGSALGHEFKVNTYIDDSQFNASVAMDADGDFVVTWV